jgi:hypothetical protein
MNPYERWHWAMARLQAGKRVRWHTWLLNNYWYWKDEAIWRHDPGFADRKLESENVISLQYVTQPGWELYSEPEPEIPRRTPVLQGRMLWYYVERGDDGMHGLSRSPTSPEVEVWFVDRPTILSILDWHSVTERDPMPDEKAVLTDGEIVKVWRECQNESWPGWATHFAPMPWLPPVE